MSDGVAIALISATATVLVGLPTWVNTWMNRQEKKMKEDRDECRRELAEIRQDYKKAIQLAIEKSRNL